MLKSIKVVDELVLQKKSTWEIEYLTEDYAATLGHTDFRDRRYIPMAEDIVSIASKLKREGQ